MENLLKHQWTKQEQIIILGLKNLLREISENIFRYGMLSHFQAENIFYVQQGIFAAMKEQEDRKDIVRSWQIMKKMSASSFSRDTPKPFMQEHVAVFAFFQAVLSLFSDKKGVLNNECRKLLEEFFFCETPIINGEKRSGYLNYGTNDQEIEWRQTHRLPWVRQEQLPVRLQDQFMEAGQKGDIAKLIFLLDSALTRGEKPKNICHLLLNKDNYKGLAAIGDLQTNLAKTPQDRLKVYWLHCPDETPEEQYFSREVFPLIRLGRPWEELHNARRLAAKIELLLDNGVSPDLYIYYSSGIKIRLKKYFHFLDEISESLPQLRRMDYALEDDWTACKKYFAWLEKNKEVNNE